MIPDEPVRGHIPPPWYGALPGIERVRAFSRGQLPLPPLARLLGLRTTHVVPGGVTVAMPATEASLTGNGQLEIVPLMMAALDGASKTAVGGGVETVPLKFTIEPFRPAWVRPGNLLARARVVNGGNLFVLAEVHVEDADGRHIAQGVLQSSMQRLDPPPPLPPETMPSVDEPVYDTPDPYLRNFPATPMDDRFEQEDGLALCRGWAEDAINIPVADLYGVQIEEYALGRARISMPASDWFSASGGGVSPNAIAAFGDMAAWAAAMTLHQRGHSVVGLDENTRFLRAVRADGRRLCAETEADELAPNLFVAESRIRDADGELVAVTAGSMMRLDASQRARRPRTESKRVLLTLLFTDIVGSTEHAERVGDARWRALLEEHRLAARREFSRHNGTEVDTAGDGFFVRFDSPAQAIEAARAAVRAAARLGIEIRAGIHTGECELRGNKPTGMAVHIAARIQAAAQPGEVLASSTVKDLAVGSGLRFADRGEQNLKGVPDPWRFYAVVD
jgi:uncharacterized protein (TIGR00369 family)